MQTFRLVVVAVVLALPLAARADLAPAKGSQLVSAYTFGACPIPGHTGSNSSLLTQMVNGDGAVVALVIPPKRILVLTDLTATTGAEPGGDVIAASVIVGSATSGSPVAAHSIRSRKRDDPFLVPISDGPPPALLRLDGEERHRVLADPIRDVRVASTRACRA